MLYLAVCSEKINIQLKQIPEDIQLKLALVFKCYKEIMSLVLFEFNYIVSQLNLI